MPSIERISPDTFGLFKRVRLQALQEAPSAFGSTYAKESEFTEEDWLKRAAAWNSERSVCYMAMENGTGCGIVSAFVDEVVARRAHVVSMWVAPAHRRTGLGTALMYAVRNWAEARDISELELMVTSNNHGALRFYEELGFARNGVTEPYPNDLSLFEYQMRRSLRSSDALSKQ